MKKKALLFVIFLFFGASSATFAGSDEAIARASFGNDYDTTDWNYIHEGVTITYTLENFVSSPCGALLVSDVGCSCCHFHDVLCTDLPSSGGTKDERKTGTHTACNSSRFWGQARLSLDCSGSVAQARASFSW